MAGRESVLQTPAGAAKMFVFIQAFDVNMNPTAGPSAAGVFANGLSCVRGQVSGLTLDVEVSRKAYLA